MAISGTKADEAAFGQYGSSYLNGDGDLINLESSTKVFICAITMCEDTTFQKLENLGGDIRSISTVTAENDHDHATGGFGASANSTDVTTSHTFKTGVTIYGKWDHVELNSGGCICYYAPL
jgi:hypothetical protein